MVFVTKILIPIFAAVMDQLLDARLCLPAIASRSGEAGGDTRFSKRTLSFFIQHRASSNQYRSHYGISDLFPDVVILGIDLFLNPRQGLDRMQCPHFKGRIKRCQKGYRQHQAGSDHY